MFIKPTGETEKRIWEAQSSEAIRELCHQAGIQSGILQRQPDGIVVPVQKDERVEPTREYARRIYVGNKQIDLTSTSVQMLDELEAAARAQFGPK